MTYQNGTQYEVWMTTDAGVRLGVLDSLAALTYTLVVNNTGFFRLDVCVPASLPKLSAGSFASGAPAVNKSWFAKDRRVLIWRRPEGGAMTLAFVGLIRRLQTATNPQGMTQRVISGTDLNGLLKRRIVAYAAGEAEAAKSGPADDLLAEIVDENLGASATDTDRRLSSDYFSVAASPGAGATVEKSFAWRNQLDVLREIADASREAGTYLFFGMVPTSDTAFEFRTRTNEWGRDRTSDVGNGLIFGLDFGNMANPLLDEDSMDEVNYAYGLGRGDEDERNVQESEDTTRSGASIFARAEAAANAVLETTDAGVLDVADARVQKGRPLTTFTAKLLSVPGAVYDKDYTFGDRLTGTYDGRQVDFLMRAVTVSLDDRGKEDIAPIIELVA